MTIKNLLNSYRRPFCLKNRRNSSNLRKSRSKRIESKGEQVRRIWTTRRKKMSPFAKDASKKIKNLPSYRGPFWLDLIIDRRVEKKSIVRKRGNTASPCTGSGPVRPAGNEFPAYSHVRPFAEGHDFLLADSIHPTTTIYRRS